MMKKTPKIIEKLGENGEEEDGKGDGKKRGERKVVGGRKGEGRGGDDGEEEDGTTVTKGEKKNPCPTLFFYSILSDCPDTHSRVSRDTLPKTQIGAGQCRNTQTAMVAWHSSHVCVYFFF